MSQYVRMVSRSVRPGSVKHALIKRGAHVRAFVAYQLLHSFVGMQVHTIVAIDIVHDAFSK